LLFNRALFEASVKSALPPILEPSATAEWPAAPADSAWRAYLRLMRPSDWLKNVLVAAPLVFSQRLGDGVALGQTAAAFAVFCLLASGFYAINDALDAASDRAHPVKRRRPVASGAIGSGAACRFGAILVLLGLAVACWVNPLLAVVAAGYLVLQVFYNAWLKRVLMVDVVALALGFVLRAAAGGAAIGVQVSIWLVLCVFFLCRYLGFVKRMSDETATRQGGLEGGVAGSGGPGVEGGEGGWHSPAGYGNLQELNWLLAVSAGLTIVTYLMYALSQHTRTLFGPRALGFALLSPLVVIAIYRFYRRSLAGRSDRPLDAFFEDRGIRLCGILFAAGVLITLYAPGVDHWLGRLFMP
jgi:4-hydroxybenzoate polyprenyltransferase